MNETSINDIFSSATSLDLSQNTDLDTSYVVNTKPVNDVPLRAKDYKDYRDNIKENFFGE